MFFWVLYVPARRTQAYGREENISSPIHMGSNKRCDEENVGVRTDPWIRKSEKSQVRPVGSTDEGSVFQVKWNRSCSRVQNPPDHNSVSAVFV